MEVVRKGVAQTLETSREWARARLRGLLGYNQGLEVMLYHKNTSEVKAGEGENSGNIQFGTQGMLSSESLLK